MIGMDSIKGESTASLLLNLISIPMVIVVPLLDVPGTSATACAMPITIAMR